MTEKTITEQDVYKLTWEYFKLHGQQRLTYLNYFIVFSMALATAQIGVLSSNAKLQFIGIIIGCMQMFLSFVFIKIDNRNSFLTKLSEQVLKEMESQFDFSDDQKYLEKIRLFTLEERLTAEKKMMSHRKTYKAIVITFFVVGLLGLICAIVLTIITHIAV